ncbi:gamma-glutamyl-gamma-aminobutyrate hydrolase family protein [Legionella shakespearei]|uniref:Putative glutamine amidotransferase n=1 Tax=Legionella shakespearei DSM 23087 TaxID=1122169 RepID=A0A0W0Z6W4_9GAMM|nr:gamma-glutamyl-gamma-aminobutyrate hydrolase family protein [Legionella shakespearei]KTD64595.1 putative glutamine amidotransferase [Legionella shakespearei DSM 23087]
MGVITQIGFEDLLDQLKLEKEKLLPGQKLSFADFLKKNGYETTLNAIHFAIENKTVTHSKMQSKDGSLSTVTTVPRRTDLLYDIDFTGCDLSQCDFSDCDLTGFVCTNMTLNECTFNGTVLNDGLMSNVILERTRISDTTFDYGTLNNVRFIDCPIEYSSFNFLKELKDVTLEGCSIRSVALLGGVPAERVSIRAPVQPDEPTQTIEDFRTDKAVVLHNVVKQNFKPAVLLPWNDSTPGMSATLTERVLLSKGIQPVRMDYKPQVDAKALDKEINDLNGLTQEKMDMLKAKVLETARKIASMKAQEREKALDAAYTKVVPLAVYNALKSVTFGLLSNSKVSDKDITEQFDAQWKKQGISFPMLMIEIMREEHAKDHNKFPQAAQLYEHAKSVFDKVDGVMIAGAQDIDPRFYGQKQAPETVLETYPDQPDVIDSRRDLLEFSLVYMQQKASAPKPFCGVCRGSQVTAVAYGGTLSQGLKTAERHDFFVETIQPAQSTAESPRLSMGSRLSLTAEDRGVLNALFFQHQGYDLTSARGLNSVDSIHTSSGAFIDVIAEHLPQNIFIVQAHPDFGTAQNTQDLGAIDLQLGGRIAESVFGQFSTRVQAFHNAQKVSSELMTSSVLSSGRIFLGRNEDEDRTASVSIPEKTKDYQTVCIGMGPVGLLAALSAMDRGEKIVILTDRAPDTGLSIRQQVLGVDDEAMMFVKSLVRPEIWEYYVRNNIITLHPYDAPNPDKPGKMMSLNYWYFSIGGLEKMLIDECSARIDDRCIKLSGKSDPEEAREAVRSQVGIDVLVVDKIDPKLTASIQLSGKTRLNYSSDTNIADILKYLRAQTLLRQKHMDIRQDEKTITVTGIKSVNGVPTPVAEQRQTFGYEHIAIANGGKQAAEKALATVFHAENVHASEPIINSHVAVIFNLKGSLGHPPVAFDAHELMRQIEQAKKDKTSEPIKMVALREYGWTDASRPHQQIYASRANTLEHEFCYIGCEYPEALKVPAIRVAIELKLSNPAEYEKSVPARIREAIDRDPNKDHANLISKKLCRQWSRMLFQDALPENICDAHITDPVYDNPSDPIQIGQRQLETSPFDLAFSELDTSIIISGDPLHEDVGTIVSLGDGRMLPLYTTGTGFQTGAKMAMHYHHAQTALAKGLAAFKEKYHWDSGSTKDESEQYRAEYQKLIGDVYTRYHAGVRSEIDKIRVVQAEWIEKRNERVLKAASVFYVMEQATEMWERTQKVAIACEAIKGDSRQGSFFAAEGKEFKDLIPDKAMAEKFERIRAHMRKVTFDLNQFYVQFDEHQITAYEGVPELALNKKEATVQEYYSYLRKACLSIKELEQEISSCNDFCAMDATRTGMSEGVFAKLKAATVEMQALLECDIYKRHSAENGLQISDNPFIHDALLTSTARPVVAI